MSSTNVNLGVGALIAIGGIIGYVKKQSVPSLVAGVCSGALYALSAYLINNGHALRGHQFGALISFVLSGVMAKRFMNSGKFFPAGMVSFLTAIAAVVNTNQALGH